MDFFSEIHWLTQEPSQGQAHTLTTDSKACWKIYWPSLLTENLHFVLYVDSLLTRECGPNLSSLKALCVNPHFGCWSGLYPVISPPSRGHEVIRRCVAFI